MATLLKLSWEEDVRRVSVPELTFDQVQAATLRVFSEKLACESEDSFHLEFREEGPGARSRLLTRENFGDLVVLYSRQQLEHQHRPEGSSGAQRALRLQVVPCTSVEVPQPATQTLMAIKAEPEEVPEPATPPGLVKQGAVPQPATPLPLWPCASPERSLGLSLPPVKAEVDEAIKDATADEHEGPASRALLSLVKIEAADDGSVRRAAKKYLKEARKVEKAAKRRAEKGNRKSVKKAKEARRKARKANRKAIKRAQKVMRRMALKAKTRKSSGDLEAKMARTEAKREKKARTKAEKELEEELFGQGGEADGHEASASSARSERRRRRRALRRTMRARAEACSPSGRGCWRSEAEEEEKEEDEELDLHEQEDATSSSAGRSRREKRKAERLAPKELRRCLKAQKKARKERRRCTEADEESCKDQDATGGDDKKTQENGEKLEEAEEKTEELRRLVETSFRGLLRSSQTAAEDTAPAWRSTCMLQAAQALVEEPGSV